MSLRNTQAVKGEFTKLAKRAYPFDSEAGAYSRAGQGERVSYVAEFECFLIWNPTRQAWRAKI